VVPFYLYVLAGAKIATAPDPTRPLPASTVPNPNKKDKLVPTVRPPFERPGPYYVFLIGTEDLKAVLGRPLAEVRPSARNEEPMHAGKSQDEDDRQSKGARDFQNRPCIHVLVILTILLV